jgi:hypothetical protein
MDALLNRHVDEELMLQVLMLFVALFPSAFRGRRFSYIHKNCSITIGEFG